jgi:hypothetical protein
MIKLRLKRICKKENYTIGNLYINDKWFCNTIEDKVRELKCADDKIYGETAIPEGTYKVIVNMSPKLKRRLPLLLNVPYFTGIRIHRGVNEKSSAGCIIVGENKIKGKVVNSAKYETELVKILDGEKNIEIRIE